MVPDQVRVIQARATLLGSRLDTRKLRDLQVLAAHPLTIRAGSSGTAVLFRFGAVVTFDVTFEDEASLIESVQSAVDTPLETLERETLELHVQADAPDRFDPSGWLVMQPPTVPQLQVIAHVLAKSGVLSYYEQRVGSVFDRIEGLADALSRGALSTRQSALLTQIGEALRIQAHTVGRAELTEKPELIWDRPDLDRLYEHLAHEFELRDRDVALARKLALLSETAETYLNLLHSRLNIRLEWYIVFLIVVEIILFVYEILRH